jgi:death-on-curing protein
VEPIFLSIGEIIEIHNDQIQRYGGQAGIRDLKLLQSAVAMPTVSFESQYLHQDLFEMAAAYLFHITQNHPFIDGNKRTGAVAALVFLYLNGIELKVDENIFENAVRSVAEGKWNKAQIAKFFRTNAVV